MEYELTESEKKAVDAFLEAKGLPTHINVTFRNIARPDCWSEVRSRSEINDFAMPLTKGITLAVPIIAANMPCVTGVKMVTEIQKWGGLGIIPQMLPIKDRLGMLERIGRYDSAFIDNPLTITPERTLAEAKQLMKKTGISGLIVVNDNKKPVGILSTRDWMYETDEKKIVGDLMGGKRKLYAAHKGIDFEEAAKILRCHKIEKLPLLDNKGHLVGLITAHGLFYKHHHPHATRDAKGRFLKVGSVGVGRHFTKERMSEVELQVRKGICMLLIDTARAFSINTKEAVEAIKERYPGLPLMVGNTSSPEGAKAIFQWGADVVKVGQGPGEACRTREVGVGLPQISAIAKCAAVAKLMTERDGEMRTIVGDGGPKNPGDVAMAIAAGASAVMSGRFFIRTIEAEAVTRVDKDGVKFKNYEGSASFEAQLKRIEDNTLDESRRPEGVAERVSVTSTVKEELENICGGFRSALSYFGVRSLSEMRDKAEMQIQTDAGAYEGLKR